MSDPTSADIARRIELCDAAAWVDNCRAVPAKEAAAAGLRVRTLGGAVMGVTAKVDVLAFNRVVGLGIAEPVDPAMIPEIAEFYREAGPPRFMIQLSPAAEPPDFAERLTAAGFVHHNNWMIFYRDDGPPPPARTDLRIERVGAEHAQDIAGIVSTAFAFPELAVPLMSATVGRDTWNHYLAFDGDAPVAAAALFVADEVGWLGWAATTEAARGRGAQSALITTRLRDGIDLACRWFITETAEEIEDRPHNPSFHNVQRFGFKVAYPRPNYRLTLTS